MEEETKITEMKTNELGLAAYVKMKGIKLLRVEERTFVFETEKSVDEMRVDYTNSDCYRHDNEVCNLRKFIATKK